MSVKTGWTGGPEEVGGHVGPGVTVGACLSVGVSAALGGGSPEPGS